MAYADQNSRSPRLPSIAAVAAVHGLIGYALISGLAYQFIKDVTPVFTVKSIPIDTPPPPVDQAVPPKQKVTSEQVVIVPPTPSEIRTIDREPVIVFDTSNVERVIDPVIAPPPPLPPQPKVSRSAGVQVQGNRAAWITTDDYPSAALRAEEEGVVTITVRVGADGRVGACTVTGSSGHGALDAATCRLYQRRARFTPARDDAGNAIETSYTDRVRWELPRE
jgi:protein TonB